MTAGAGRWLRVLWRGGILGVGTGALYAIFLPVHLALTPTATARRRFRDAILKLWSRLIVKVLAVRLEVEGTPPKAPFLMVSNHLSYVDIPILAALVGGRFVAKAEVRGWPALGLLSRSAGTLFVDRTSRRDVIRVGRRISEALAAGDSIVLFPEGTSTSGEDVAPFRSSLLADAAGNRPVHYASLSYCSCSPHRADLKVCWWGDMSFAPHFVDLLALPGFSAKVTFGETPIVADCRKELALQLRDAVRAQFEPVKTIAC